MPTCPLPNHAHPIVLAMVSVSMVNVHANKVFAANTVKRVVRAVCRARVAAKLARARVI
tara:strand:- start:2663 stop:2839 length:177 start_codon:yes stop_codon:yes gene_type:complete